LDVPNSFEKTREIEIENENEIEPAHPNPVEKD
jgi:hypothetical protein